MKTEDLINVLSIDLKINPENISVDINYDDIPNPAKIFIKIKSTSVKMSDIDDILRRVLPLNVGYTAAVVPD